MSSNPLSNCHQAPLKAITGDEGTSYYQCSECKEPADIFVEEEGPQTPLNNQTPDLREQLKEIAVDCGVEHHERRIRELEEQLRALQIHLGVEVVEVERHLEVREVKESE